MLLTARQWLDRIHALPLHSKVRIMNVCGGHERSIMMAGLRSILPEQIELIPGPGCPVCICPEEDIYEAMQIALHEDVILVTFGDMVRVPVNAPKASARSLADARAQGADIRPIASPRDAVQIAQTNPDKIVVFFAAGFETTTAPVIAMLAEGVPANLQLLLSGRLTWPAVTMLLSSDEPDFDCLVAPGHVATVMGSQQWRFVPEQYHLPAAIAGFTSESLLAAFYSVLRQSLERNPFLDNCYPQLVSETGNAVAKQLLEQVTDVVMANWRGIGVIAQSGFVLKDEYTQYDARKNFVGYRDEARKHAGQMPPGCDCARVVLGKIYPVDCKLYGTACTPRTPVGPCMVSDEGACRIWWSGGARHKRTA